MVARVRFPANAPRSRELVTNVSCANSQQHRRRNKQRRRMHNTTQRTRTKIAPPNMESPNGNHIGRRQSRTEHESAHETMTRHVTTHRAQGWCTPATQCTHARARTSAHRSREVESRVGRHTHATHTHTRRSVAMRRVTHGRVAHGRANAPSSAVTRGEDRAQSSTGTYGRVTDRGASSRQARLPEVFRVAPNTQHSCSPLSLPNMQHPHCRHPPNSRSIGMHSQHAA